MIDTTTPISNVTYNGTSIPLAGGTPGEATYDDLGSIKLGSSTAATQTMEAASSAANRQYPLQLDANGRASTNVPWIDPTALTYKGAWVSGTSYNKYDIVYTEASGLRTYYTTLNDIVSSTTTPASDMTNFKVLFSAPIETIEIGIVRLDG